jgi:GT2 family glycosyltransferase
VRLRRNRGFAGNVNAGVRAARGEVVCLLNNDAQADPGWVSACVETLQAGPTLGAVASKIVFADVRTLNSAGDLLGRDGAPRQRGVGQPDGPAWNRVAPVFGASGGAALHRRRMLDAVGGIDDSYFFGLEDVDLAWRARMAGWRSLYAPSAVVHHRHGATGSHGSDLKYFHVGLDRVRTLAKNADRRQLLRYGVQIVAFDVAYVAFVALVDRSLAPLRGRLAGLREWRQVRAANAARRRPIELERRQGLVAALRRRRAWLADSGRPPRAA